jgi:hypothetical protein
VLDPNTYTIERRSFLDYRPGPQPNGHATIEDWPDPLSDAAYHGLAGDVVRRQRKMGPDRTDPGG